MRACVPHSASAASKNQGRGSAIMAGYLSMRAKSSLAAGINRVPTKNTISAQLARPTRHQPGGNDFTFRFDEFSMHGLRWPSLGMGVLAHAIASSALEHQTAMAAAAFDRRRREFASTCPDTDLLPKAASCGDRASPSWSRLFARAELVQRGEEYGKRRDVLWTAGATLDLD